MRLLLIAATIVALLSAACGDDDATPAAPAASATAAATAAASGSPVATVARTQAAAATARATAPAGESVEVTGIVGGLNLNGNIIEIKRLQGAAVTQISVDARTVIRKAAGGTVAFKDIRTSDRIIARGTLNDRGDVLQATNITVGEVIPGSQPGG
jgi:hypothetical protein